MFFRHLIPIARVARPCWRLTTRGKRDLPIWRRDPFFWRPRFWDDPWFRGGPQLGLRAIDEYMQEQMRQMDTLFKLSPWRRMEMMDSEANAHGIDAVIVKTKFGKDGLHVELNVSHFHPDDLQVRISGDRLVISGKHSSKQDERGFVAREFTREFLIPEEVDQDTFTCRLNDDGHLFISAAVKEDAASGRNLTIERGSDEKQEKE